MSDNNFLVSKSKDDVGNIETRHLVVDKYHDQRQLPGVLGRLGQNLKYVVLNLYCLLDVPGNPFQHQGAAETNPPIQGIFLTSWSCLMNRINRLVDSIFK